MLVLEDGATDDSFVDPLADAVDALAADNSASETSRPRREKMLATAFRASRTGMTRTYQLSPGVIVQGGADATKPFYSMIRNGDAARLVIVNVARRTGEPSVQLLGDNRILWLPMTEASKEADCKAYLDTHADSLIANLRDNATVVVNCQEGVHRSVEFTRQLLRRCEARSPWVENLQE